VESAPAAQGGRADPTFGASAQIVSAAGIALLLAGVAALIIYAGRAPRVTRGLVRAAKFARSRQLRQTAPVSTADLLSPAAVARRPTPRPTTSLASDSPLTDRQLVNDDLAAGAASPLPKILRTMDRAGHGAEALKEKPRLADAPKRSKAGPRTEADLLRRKAPADGWDAFKAGEREGLPEKKRFAPGDAAALKDKLTSRPVQQQAAKPR
jgi:hypothetical protein